MTTLRHIQRYIPHPTPKPLVRCARCKKWYVRPSRHTKLCTPCWNKAQSKRVKLLNIKKQKEKITRHGILEKS